MSESPGSYAEALETARKALQAGDKSAARDWALAANKLAPDQEDPWLILAAVASPRASIEYLNQALEINPNSQRARQGMHWAARRLRASQPVAAPPPPPSKPLVVAAIPKEALVRQRPAILPWLIILCVLFILLATASGYPLLSGMNRSDPLLAAAQGVDKATRTPEASPTEPPIATPTDTPPPTSSPTETLPPTATDIPTFTPLPTATETPLPTETPFPTDTPEPIPTETEAPPEPEPAIQPNGQGELPLVAPGERWVDVDLSQQRVFAYEGDQIVNTFLVSTGTRNTPTVQGLYRIYVKYRAATMSGPGYYLPDVPYVMYFYKGYGLHGTYWHHNFGTPMSHGCVNLKTREARWLYDWTSVGTLVYVHR